MLYLIFDPLILWPVYLVAISFSSEYFNAVCENWGKNGKFNVQLVKSLQTHLKSGNAKVRRHINFDFILG